MKIESSEEVTVSCYPKGFTTSYKIQNAKHCFFVTVDHSGKEPDFISSFEYIDLIRQKGLRANAEGLLDIYTEIWEFWKISVLSDVQYTDKIFKL